MGAWWSKPPTHEGDDKEKGEEEEEEEEEEVEEVEEIEEGMINEAARDWYAAIEMKLALRTILLGTKNKASFIGRKVYLARSPIYAEHLAEFSSIREARKDLDCFYRSFAFSYLEHILEMQDRHEVNRMLAILEKYEQRERNLAGKATCFPAFSQEFRDLLSSYSKLDIIRKAICSYSFRHRRKLLLKFQDEESPMKIILLLRMIIAIEILTHDVTCAESVYSRNLEKFCLGGVFPDLGVHAHAEILSNALRVPVRVVDLAPVDPGAAIASHSNTFTPSAARKSSVAAPFEITLLYRPGKRYDILYADEVTCFGLGELLL